MFWLVNYCIWLRFPQFLLQWDNLWRSCFSSSSVVPQQSVGVQVLLKLANPWVGRVSTVLCLYYLHVCIYSYLVNCVGKPRSTIGINFFLFFSFGPLIRWLEGRHLPLSRPFSESCPWNFGLFERFTQLWGLLTCNLNGCRLSQGRDHLQPREVL